MIKIAVCGPSKSGKSTIIKKLQSCFDDVQVSFIETDSEQQMKECDHIIYVEASRDVRLCRFLKQELEKDRGEPLKLIEAFEESSREKSGWLYKKENADIIITNDKKNFDIDLYPIVNFIQSQLKLKKINPANKNTIVNPTFDAKKVENKEGHLFIISGPTGVGKTTLIKELIKIRPEVERLIPYSSREMRTGEVYGDPYRFITPIQFKSMLERETFLQHFTDYGRDYGIPLQEVQTKLAEGKNLIIDVSVSVLQEVRDKIPNSTAIYICPARVSLLSQRLQVRGDETSSITQRTAKAIDELEHARYINYDYLVINDEIHIAAHKLSAIIEATRLSTANQLKANLRLFSEFRVYKVLERIKSKFRLDFDLDNFSIQPLSSMNNYSFRVADSKRSFFLRIPRRIEDGYRISSVHEQHNIDAARRLGIYPPTTYYDDESYAYLANYLIDYLLLTDKKLHSSPLIIKYIATALLKLHRSNAFSNDYNPLQYDEKNLVKMKREQVELPDDIDTLAVSCHRISDLLQDVCPQKVSCNNDISPFNMLYKEDQQEIVISDWECSGNYDPFWDLAKLSVEGSFTTELDQLLVQFYTDDTKPEALARLNLYKILIEYHLGIWAKWQIVQKNTAVRKEKFEQLFTVRMENCRNHIRSPNFLKHIAMLQTSFRDNSKNMFISRLRGSPSFWDYTPPFRRISFQPRGSLSVSSTASQLTHNRTVQNQLTLMILKPDIPAQLNIGAVIVFVEEHGFKIISTKTKVFDSKQVFELYPQISDEDTCFHVVDLMTSGPCVLLVLEKENAAESLRKLKGRTDPRQADASSLRGKFGSTIKWNAVHCSDNADAAEREIALFFKPEEIGSVLSEQQYEQNQMTPHAKM